MAEDMDATAAVPQTADAAAEPSNDFAELGGRGDFPEEELGGKGDRVIRRAKRILKPGAVGGEAGVSNGVGAGGGAGGGVGGFSAKNSRKSRNSYNHSRGQPKKGGAGGKGVWGKPGSELEESGVCVDSRDPNYDSDSQDEYKLVQVTPVLDEEQLDKAVRPIILEYMEHGNSDEVKEALAGLSVGAQMPRVLVLALTLALDRHNPQRELVSRLISDLYSCVLTRDDIARGFDDMLAALDDVVLDTPDAHVNSPELLGSRTVIGCAAQLLGQFMARCVADDCLAPKYITSYKDKADNEWIKGAVEKAEILLSMKNGIAHLDNIWGVGGGNRPVKYLTNQMIDLLKEFLNSGDENEAMRCLVELDVPHFHHELVYQACDLVIEDSSARVRDQMVALLKLLTSTNVVVSDQFSKGMKRVFDDIADINLDVPAAYTLLEELVSKLRAEGMVGEALIKELPQAKGRKRFVSEGDGGKLKTA